MHLFSTTITLAALLVTGAAGAAGTDKGNTKGGSGPGSASGPTGGASEGASDSRDSGVDRLGGTTKVWEIGAAWEYHHLIRQEDLNGAGVNKNLNYFSLYARWDITPMDRVQIYGGIYQRFIADEGETGVRADDLSFSYTRRVPLPGEVQLKLSGRLTAPISFNSQKASLITSPRGAVQVSRKFGTFNLDARLSGTGYIVKYASYDGGANPNPRGLLGATLSGDYAMPFLESLSIGATLYTGYLWFYDVYGSAGPNMTLPGAGANTRLGQPNQQEYGGEVYIRYSLPSLGGFKSDITLALSQGDPTLGYASVIHDGEQHVYPFYRQTAQFYGVLGARY
jgi:hypothetical protein